MTIEGCGHSQWKIYAETEAGWQYVTVTRTTSSQRSGRCNRYVLSAGGQAEREFAYSEPDNCSLSGFQVVSMKNDWKVIVQGEGPSDFFHLLSLAHLIEVALEEIVEERADHGDCREAAERLPV